jgi:uncharacterized protein
MRYTPVMAAVFHLSFPVSSLDDTRAFYSGILGCREGKSTPKYVDFEFLGNQLTCHLSPNQVRPAAQFGLDGNHFGVIVALAEFLEFENRLRGAKAAFVHEPTVQHAGTARERRKMVFTDPSGNAIEIKSYVDPAKIFA